MFALVWLLVLGIAEPGIVPAVVLGLLSLSVAVLIGFLCINSWARRLYAVTSRRLEDYCSNEVALIGYKLFPIGPFALIAERANG